ncbi:hypothetical protein RMN57_05165 [Kitasatospora sp. CM 4170]|uniref:Integral membrane protein n=1 Tax=Kitasatospora aburaviensis TaxID=67265 RepID=A0ABW1F6A4_9ACTN|nr:hypothetical protein [Kitasatospora sp. CM 4170]WNM44146.1 hypothetical protein RMN57_05165 [Kitasatospora sp. CM 4170]
MAQLESDAAKRAPTHHRMRTFGSTVLVVVASILSILAVVAVWAHNEVTDTDRFVSSLAPLAHNPDVQNALANRLTNAAAEQVDVKALVNDLSQAAAEQGVPPRLADLIGGLSGPLEGALTNVIHAAAEKVVTSDAFATVWEQALRLGHASMVKALTGEGGGAVQLKNDEVTIDIGPMVDKVKTELVNAGFAPAAKIPAVHTDFVVFSSPDIAKIKGGFRLLEVLGNWLPVIVVLVAAAGVFTAFNRRRALVGAAVGIALAMLLMGIVLTVFRSYFLDHLPSDASPAAAGAVYDALVTYLRTTVRVVGVLALVVAIGALMIGPSRVAVTIRSVCGHGVAAVRHAADSAGFHAGPVDAFVRRWKRWIGIMVLLGAAVIFAFWDHPTGMVVFWFAVVVLALFAIREFFAPAYPAGGPLVPRAPATRPGPPAAAGHGGAAGA